DYMIPSYFVQLEKLPLTVNGKIDRKALPEPDGSMASGITYEAPTNAIEEKLVTIWQEILKINKIGIRDNFFDLGGHSLKATILVSRIHKELNVEIPLREVFSKPTIRDMAEFIREADGGIYTSIELVEKKEYYSVSAAQKRMYILNQLDSEGLTYNMPLPLLIEGKLDKGLFEAAFLKLIERHEALRTSFETIGGEPVQRIHEKVDLHIEYLEEEEEKAVKKLKEFIKPFDLSKAPLLRVVLIKTKEDKHILLYDMHHIISDGLTMSIIINEFAKIYKGIELPKLRIQYKDYSAWQEKLRENGVIEKQTEYWKEEFKNDVPVLNLPTDYARPSIQSFEGDNVSFEVEEEIKLKISQLTHDTRTTVYMVLFAAFNTLLMKYTGQEDIIVSSPIAGRGHADLENIVGMFVNNLAIRSQPSGDKTFKEYLYEVKEKTLKAYENQDVQFEGLVELLNIQRDVSRNPLFDVVFVLNNTDNDNMDLEEIKIRTIDVNNKISKFDIMMSAFESEDKIYFNTEFCTKLFKKETIEAMCVRFKKLLDEVLKNPDKKMSEIDILTPEEKNRIIFKFNDTYVDYPKEKLIYQLFEEQVERTPDAIAVICGDKHLTYKHLNEKSNQLARLLISKGIKKDRIVGIMIEHSLEAVIGIMGVLKAGGAYLPIDPEYPEDRIRYMQEDSEAGILLTLSSLKREIDPRVDTICLDDEKIYIGEGINPELNNTPTDIAYVIYTSGSTGNPKGVLVSHLGLVNYICWADKVYINGEKLDFPLYSSLCFDLTVTSIFTPLISGNKIIVYGGGNKEFLIKRIIEEDKVGIVKLTPTHLHLIREFGIKASNIKKLIVGGEDLKVVTANEIYKLFNGNIEIFNEYGPTEATVGCMIYKYDHKKDLRISVPIGVPAQNVQIYLLDQHLKPVPVNVVGEIYISGNGIARGYINRAELTEKSFIPNPFIPDKKMYKTGDNARMLPDGNIEYIGRKDYQAKINGFRIETGEIEAQILKLEAVSDVVVDIRENKKDHNMNEIIYCSKCGLPSNYPNTTYDKDMVCNMCRDYYEYKEKADSYFKTMIELEEMFGMHKANNKADYDCMVLFSGGKDSSYVLYKLVDMGFKVLALTLDNGYISETALENIDNIIKELKIDNVIIRPENMKEIFCESLMAESNVCNGCFKTLLALSTKMAYEKGIKYVVTGLSRGQIYEMRLTSLFISKVFDPQEVDKAVLEARKVYHGMDDYISRLLDVELLKDETVFDEVEFIDFYRYSDAKKTEIFDFLKSRSSIWSRPSDTGFCSSNCRINDVGIYVHCKEQGYHNYALPTCWEVRTNHLTLEAGKEELSGDVNIEQVKTILNEIGYSESGIRNIDFSKYLAAYYVADKSLTVSELRSHLRKELPDYMVPLYFVQMEKLPLTPNGKLDRKALPEPHGSVSSEAAYEAPTNEIEEILVKIWQEVLGVKQVGIKDNFFAMGGDSIKVIQASTRLLKYGMAIEHKDIFKYQTISVLAPFVKKNHREVYQGIIEGEVILTPIQRWYFENYRTNNNHFNHTVMLFRRDGFNEAILHKVLERLLEHHDALRMVFREEDGEIIQYNMGISENKIRVVEIADAEDYIKQIQVETEKTQQSIDLQKGPLFKAVLFKTSQGDHLQVVIHHLIVDGISWRILLEDLVSAYAQVEKNEEIELPDKTDAYKLWAEKIYEYSNSNKMLREIEYWKQIDTAPVKLLPKDYDYDNICHDEDESIEITFTQEETNSLLVSVNKAYNTEINDILLTALGMAISDWTNESSVAVWLEGHGREEIIKEVDIKRTVGWFTSIYPFVLDMSKKEALGYQIKTVKEGLRKIPEKGVGYSIIKYMTDKTVVGENVLRLTPQIIFNYLGQFDTDMYTDSFKQSEISPGTAIGKDNERLYAIDISGMIANGKLSMSFGYSRKEYKRFTIQKISDNYKSCLQRIINVCTELKESEVTPSDLGSKTLSLEGLDKINALLKNKLKLK
ncbi:MAG: amino acid adenylation domain-containing protein, partial [Lutisporaceae bacterium]